MKSTSIALTAVSISVLVLVAGCTSSSGPKYYAAFTEYAGSPITYQGYVPQGKTLNIYFNATTVNLTQVKVTLAWYDDSGDGCEDELALEVKAPFEDALYLPSKLVNGVGNITISVTIQHLPKEKKGNDKEPLQEWLNGVANFQGQGNWTISITCVNTQPNCPNPKTTDGGNGWIISIVPFHFEGSIMEAET